MCDNIHSRFDYFDVSRLYHKSAKNHATPNWFQDLKNAMKLGFFNILCDLC